MKCAVGIDLGSTTTKAVLIDEDGTVVGQGITNSRSNYEVACAVAREEAMVATRLSLLDRALQRLPDGAAARNAAAALPEAFRLERYRDQLDDLEAELFKCLDATMPGPMRASLGPVLRAVIDEMQASAAGLFGPGAARRSDFFRDLAAASFMSLGERATASGAAPFEALAALFDRAILDVETRLRTRPFEELLTRALGHVRDVTPFTAATISGLAAETAIEEVAFVGTGYGRQTLPFPKECVRSEILCHGRGAHAVFPGTRTVLDIGGQDTKAIQVDEGGVVTSFQMNDRCAAGCGRYLGYIADEMNMGLHELGPLAMKSTKTIRINSTCTVFAGAELRDRLSLGDKREDIMAGLHRAIILRAMSILARSGGIRDEFTFTGGVAKNEAAVKALTQLVEENYGRLTLNINPDSIYTGALGGATFAYRAVVDEGKTAEART